MKQQLQIEGSENWWRTQRGAPSAGGGDQGDQQGGCGVRLSELSWKAGRALWAEGTGQSMTRSLLPVLTLFLHCHGEANSPFFSMYPSPGSPAGDPISLICCPSQPPHICGPAWDSWILWKTFQFPSCIPSYLPRHHP